MRTSAALALLLALAVVGAERSAPAQPAAEQSVERARELYAQARRAFQEERYRDAAVGFEAASKLHAHAVALYTAAQAWELASEPARAADAYARALETPGLSDAQSGRARERLNELTPQLGVIVAAGEQTTRVQLDDQMQMTLPARLHGLPGDHALVVVYGDGKVDRRQVKLEAGQTVDVPLSAPPAQTAAPRVVPLAEPRKHGVRADDPSPQRSPWITVGLVATGAGAAALGGAVLLGLSANDAEGTYKATPSRQTLEHAQSLETSTNVMLLVGGVLTAAGVSLLIWQATTAPPRAQRIELRLAPRAVELGGRF